MKRFWVAVLLILLGSGHSDVAARNIIYVANLTGNAIFQSVQNAYPYHHFVDLNGEWQYREEGIALRVPFAAQLNRPITLEKTIWLSHPGDSLYYLHLVPQNCGIQVQLNDSTIFQRYQPYFRQKILLPFSLLRQGANRITIQLVPYQQQLLPLPEWMPENQPRIMGGIHAVFLERMAKGQFTPIIYQTRVVDSLMIIRWQFPSTVGSDTLLRAHVTIFHNDAQLYSNQHFLRGKKLMADTLTQFPLWSPSDPGALYFRLEIYQGDTIRDAIMGTLANRKVSVHHPLLLLNHQRAVFHGSNYLLQMENGVEIFNLAQVRQDLQFLKSRKFNSLYVFHHPLPEPFYRICDELGIAVFQALPIFLNGRKGFRKYPTYSHWIDQVTRMVALANRHPSIMAIGIATQFIQASPAVEKLLTQFARQLPESSVPFFIHTLIPVAQLPEGVQFQLVEVFKRHKPYMALQELIRQAAEQLIFPVVSGKALTYRVDSTTVVHDLVQIQLLTRFIQEPLKNGQLQGSFIHSYSDYYLNMPSVQNGIHGNFYLNKIGMVALNRQEREGVFSEVSSGADRDVPLVISEAFSSRSYLYIILGLLNAFIFLFTYQRFVEFRRNVLYAIKKPHGFFVNIQERRVIPFSETFLLMLVLALNAGISWSSIFYFFRNNFLFDYLLSLVFFRPAVKAFVVETIWLQWRFILLGTIVVLIVFYLLAIPIKLFSLRQQHRILFRQAWSSTVWAAAPFLLLFPFVPLMYNLLLSMKSYWIPLGVLLYFHVWFYFRWINALRVLTDRLYGRTLLMMSLLVILGFIGVGAVLQWQYGLWDHLARIYQLFGYSHQ